MTIISAIRRWLGLEEEVAHQLNEKAATRQRMNAAFLEREPEPGEIENPKITAARRRVRRRRGRGSPLPRDPERSPYEYLRGRR